MGLLRRPGTMTGVRDAGLGFILVMALAGCVGTPEKADPAVQVRPVDAAPAGGETSPGPSLPNWRVGDRWVWSDGYGLEVAAINGDVVRFDRLDAENQWHSRKGILVIQSNSATTHRELLYRKGENPNDIFPLRVGNQAVFEREYAANGKVRVHNTSWVVEGREVVEVPAGTFDCWILVRRTRNKRTGWTSFERWWYNPEVKHYVRMEYRYGNTEGASRVLKVYRLAP